MRVPKLNRVLELEELVRLPDGAGGHESHWQMVGVLWAEVRPGSGAERAGPAGPLSRYTHRITVRGAPPGSEGRPVPGQRFREGERLFRILAVTERDDAGRFLLCQTEEEVAS